MRICVQSSLNLCDYCIEITSQLTSLSPYLLFASNLKHEKSPWQIMPSGGYKYLKGKVRGFPGGAVVENLPANAGDTGSNPGLGRSHMPQSGWAREPQLLSLRVWSLCSAMREAATVRGPRIAMKSGPRLPQLEKALAQKRRPNTAKINQSINQSNIRI